MGTIILVEFLEELAGKFMASLMKHEADEKRWRGAGYEFQCIFKFEALYLLV